MKKYVLEDPNTWSEKHRKFLFVLALRKIDCPEIARDLVQDTLLEAWVNRGKYKGQVTTRGWLATILLFKIQKVYRKRTARRRGDINWRQKEVLEDRNGHFVIKPKPRPARSFFGIERTYLTEPNGPDEAFTKGEFLSVLNEALLGLSDKCRRVFELRELEGLNVEETAEKLGISQSDVKVTLFRTRKRLQPMLAEAGYIPT